MNQQDTDEKYICDKCKSPFMPGGGSYVGAYDPGDESCSPFTRMATYCGKCNPHSREAKEARINEALEEYPGIVSLDGLHSCIIGVMERFGMESVLIYDREKVLEHLMEQQMTRDEAEDFYDYNIIGLWAGDRTPGFFIPLEIE